MGKYNKKTVINSYLCANFKSNRKMNVVDRFLQYVKFDTQSDELTNMTPSTPGQMEFAQYLESVLK